MVQKEEIFVGVDVGSSKIATVIAKREGDEHLSIIGVGTSRLSGLSKGVINELEETVSGISESIEIAERMAGVDVTEISLNINGSHISSVNSSGVVGVGRADKEITHEDVARAQEAAQAVQISPNKAIHHIFPRSFKVDDQEGVKDPVGMTGIRLEVETHVIAVLAQALRNLEQCVGQVGVKPRDIIVSPVAAAKAVTQKRQRDLGCVVVDIGQATTGIAVYEDGELFHTGVLPVGGLHITNDIAIGLRTSIDIAEKVKLKYGHAYHKAVTEKDKLDLSEIDIKEDGVVSKRHLSEIIEARLEEILILVREELKKIGREALLPAGVIITGGTTKLPGIEEKAKEVLKLPVEIGQPQKLFGLTEKVYDPRMSVAVGLVLYAFEEAGVSGPNVPGGDAFKNIFNFLKNVFKHFLP